MRVAIISHDVTVRNCVLNAILLRVNHLYERVFYIGDFPDRVSSIEDILFDNVLLVIADTKLLTEKEIMKLHHCSTNFILLDEIIIDVAISSLITIWILHKSSKMIARICRLNNISSPIVNWQQNAFLVALNKRFVPSNSICAIVDILFPRKSCPIM